jgi:uncharacterized OB-fold protein
MMVLVYVKCPRCGEICDPFYNYCPQCGRSLRGVPVKTAETLEEMERDE